MKNLILIFLFFCFPILGNTLSAQYDSFRTLAIRMIEHKDTVGATAKDSILFFISCSEEDSFSVFLNGIKVHEGFNYKKKMFYEYCFEYDFSLFDICFSHQNNSAAYSKIDIIFKNKKVRASGKISLANKIVFIYIDLADFNVEHDLRTGKAIKYPNQWYAWGFYGG